MTEAKETMGNNQIDYALHRRQPLTPLGRGCAIADAMAARRGEPEAASHSEGVRGREWSLLSL
jgi:hypothetical protein